MSNIKSWSTAAASNNASSPDGFAEGMMPSGVNDSAREMMAAIRRQYEDAEWIDLGITCAYVSTTSFTLDGDRTAKFHKGRRVKAMGATTVYGTVETCSYSTKTGVVLTLDSGNLDASLTSVAVGILSYQNSSTPLVQTKIIEIGDWNMDSAASVNVAHGLTLSKIRSIQVMIRSDGGSDYYNLGTSPDSSGVVNGGWTVGTTNIQLVRTTGGLFDGTGYDQTSYNRGWITITYV